MARGLAATATIPSACGPRCARSLARPNRFPPRREPHDVEACAVALERPHERRAVHQAEDDVARGVGQVERQRGARVGDQLGRGVIAGVGHPHVQVHDRAEAEARDPAGRGERESGPRSRQATRASAAPNSPTPPQPTICHGVHGPWPKNRLLASAATAPTMKPGAPPSV